MRGQGGEWPPQAGGETEELNLEERSETEDLELTYLLQCPTYFSGRLGYRVPGECLLDLGARTAG